MELPQEQCPVWNVSESHLILESWVSSVLCRYDDDTMEDANTLLIDLLEGLDYSDRLFSVQVRSTLHCSVCEARVTEAVLCASLGGSRLGLLVCVSGVLAPASISIPTRALLTKNNKWIAGI